MLYFSSLSASRDGTVGVSDRRDRARVTPLRKAARAEASMEPTPMAFSLLDHRHCDDFGAMLALITEAGAVSAAVFPPNALIEGAARTFLTRLFKPGLKNGESERVGSDTAFGLGVGDLEAMMTELFLLTRAAAPFPLPLPDPFSSGLKTPSAASPSSGGISMKSFFKGAGCTAGYTSPLIRAGLAALKLAPLSRSSFGRLSGSPTRGFQTSTSKTEDEKSHSPSQDAATADTPPECPEKTLVILPVLASHIRTVLS
mmetsp:Transcript_23009/g.71673  ORF Transcript_23009/g.71673 Transcript_23009/m.71673 type:complete len:257 (+) Transcript_23009:273-1043(+)